MFFSKYCCNALSSDEIRYVYDATGTKLAKKVADMSENSGTNFQSTTTTEYARGYIYEKSGGYSHDGQFWQGAEVSHGLKFFSHPEGYVEPNGNGAFKYAYQYKDHLGNVRLTYADGDGNGSIDAGREIISEKNFYPFGLLHRGYNSIVSANSNSIASKFGYNNQEFDESLGLNVQEMDFRQYDPALGRFSNPDRLAELAPSLTPFRFAFNNPVYWSDPSGLYEIDDDGNIVVNNENGNNEVARLLDYLKNNKNASVDDIAEQITSSGDFWYDLDEVVITVGSSSSVSSAVDNITSQVNSAQSKISSFNGNINFTKDRNLAEWAWDNKHQIGVTAGAGFNAYAGWTQFTAGLGLLAAPEPTATKAGGAYLALDGIARMASAPLQVYGTWTGNTTLENAPSNLLGSIGFLIDNTGGGDWNTAGKAQLTMELLGDFGLSRRNLSAAVTKGFTNPNKIKNLMNIGNATWQIVRPYKDAIQLKQNGKL